MDDSHWLNHADKMFTFEFFIITNDATMGIIICKFLTEALNISAAFIVTG